MSPASVEQCVIIARINDDAIPFPQLLQVCALVVVRPVSELTAAEVTNAPRQGNPGIVPIPV